MASYDGGAQDYEVTEEGVFYQEDASGEGEESDPLASESEDDEQERQAREEVFGASIDDLIAESRRGRRRRKRKRQVGLGSGRKKARMSDLPAHLASLMGAATLGFMMKQYDAAEETLKRIISEAPKAAAPYRTLGLIYEEKGERRKALDTFMTAAELDKQDRDLWKRNAALWEEFGDSQRAIQCLSMSLRGMRGNDEDALRARGMLYLKTKRFRQAGDSFIKLSKLVPTDAAVGQLIAHAYRNVNEDERAIPALEDMVRYCERNVPRASNKGAEVRHEGSLAELVQTIVEIWFRQQKYYDASMLLGRLESRSSATGRPMTFVQRLMLAICQHRLGSETLASPTFLEFMSSPTMVAKHRFLLWQVADACRDSGDYRKGLRAYSILAQFDDEPNRTELLLHRATCNKELGNRSAAREDLQEVLNAEPRHVEASLRIMEFLSHTEHNTRSSGRRSRRTSQVQVQARIPRVKAPVVTEQTPSAAEEREHALDVLKKADTFFKGADYKGYLTCLYPALQTALQLRSPAIVQSSFYHVRQDSSACGSRNHKSSSTSELEPEWSSMRMSHADRSRLHALGSTLMRVLVDQSFVDVAERLVTCFRDHGGMALAHSLTRLFESLAHLRIKNKPDLRIRMKLLDMITTFSVRDAKRGYDQARQMLLEYPMNPSLCLAYFAADQCISMGQDPNRVRSIRFLTRLLKRHPKALYLLIVAGNCSARGGISTSTYTVGFYLRAFKLAPRNSMLCLCVAIHVLYVAMSRRVGNRNEMVMHAFAFLDEYRRCRSEGKTGLCKRIVDLETDFNIGRAMHQLGLLHMASEMYLKVLQAKVAEGENLPVWGDLRRDAAYNLAQIYQSSGSPELATAIVREFLVF